MNQAEQLRRVLTEFFDLPADTPVGRLSQHCIPKWDSLAMVQLITELQSTFLAEFQLHEIETLRSFDEILRALEQKGPS